VRLRRVRTGFAWLACALGALAGSALRAQTPTQLTTLEIPLEHCDRLPVVRLRVGDAEMRFLVDTAATTMLNLKSTAGGNAKKVWIASWSGTTAAQGREVTVPQLSLGDRTLRNFKLHAVDLSPIAQACGGTIDGILGVDLLERLGVTIDLERSVARMAVAAHDAGEQEIISDMAAGMNGCSQAFVEADEAKLDDCLDSDFVWSNPSGEMHGRAQAIEYLRREFANAGAPARLAMSIHDQRAVGNVVWTLYDFSIDSAAVHQAGRGMMICRKSGGLWYILSMHDTMNAPGARPRAAKATPD